MYTSPKDWSYYDKLSSTQAYEKLMKNNVNQELSFNSWDMSIEKTLNTSKSAIFADSTFLEWKLFWGLHTNNANLPCLVRFSRLIIILG